MEICSRGMNIVNKGHGLLEMCIPPYWSWEFGKQASNLNVQLHNTFKNVQGIRNVYVNID